jgi:YegS/Rv2252/BmrU family lipid kinase
MSESQKILFIINPVSGVGQRRMDEFKKLIGSALDHTVFSPEIVVSQYAGHAKKIAKDAVKEGVKYIAIAGGDGTVNEVAANLVGTDTLLGIIPSGSGNGLAHHLGIPVKKADAIALLNHQNVIKIDTCLVNDAFFVSIAGIGFDARVARQFAKSRKRGFLTYGRIVFREYFTYRQRQYTLSLDGEKIQTNAFFISFANSNQFGYNTRIAPNASITDGLIDVCIVRKPPVIELPLVAHLLFSHKIDKSKYMDIYRASDIIVKCKKSNIVNIDGEPVKMKKELKIVVRPASLNVIVP